MHCVLWFWSIDGGIAISVQGDLDIDLPVVLAALKVAKRWEDLVLGPFLC
ncbi:hypothetical protein KC19_VG140600 [Ceratodon purpureus]|uniref:Uncharacterized protein n=1 Tax=Ceratodon purpureus TaxID=3225 RepID=A0A8T0HPX6_CERPU|nr:hypothetical protein KC19_VG140600 [Ceratodon purpureus]